VSISISEEKEELMPVLKKLGIFLNKKDYSLDIRPLLKLVLSKSFGKLSCLVDTMNHNFVNMKEGTKIKTEKFY